MLEHGEIFRVGWLSHAWEQSDTGNEILKIRPKPHNVASLHRFAFRWHVGQVTALNHEKAMSVLAENRFAFRWHVGQVTDINQVNPTRREGTT